MPAFTNRFFALLCLLVGLESQALTLGRIQGAALIGRGLDVSIQVQLDPGQSITSACFEADVFHADTRQDPARVQVKVEPTQSPQAVRLRILSDNRIDEPIVTVYVRAGCASLISRRYVLLADFVSEQAAPVAPRVAAVPLVIPPAPDAAPGAQSNDAGTVTPGRALAAPEQPARAVARPRVAAAKPVQQRAAAPARSLPVKPAPEPKAPAAARQSTPPAKSADPQPTGQARLRLDPLELLSERVATLESTTGSVQSEAAARDAKRLDSLEASIKTLLALSARNEASLLEMKTRMRMEQEDRYNNPVVITLAALLLASLLAIMYLLVRRQRQGAGDENWWDASEAVAAPVRPAPAPAPAPAPLVDSSPAPLSVPPVSQPDSLPPRYRFADQQTQPASIVATQGLGPRVSPGNTQVDVSLVEMSESTFDRLMQSGAVHSAVRATQAAPSVQPPVEPAVARPAEGKRSHINSEELFDIRQRAEFFVSLGQTDQAVQVLESRIAQDGESSPQAFLDLLKLFHSLGLKADYAQVRGDFCTLFNADVPEFSSFTREGRELEEYPGALDRIIGVWGTGAVLATIESLLYRGQSDTAAHVFDLAAFRDLLTLHAVAQGVRSGTGLSSGAFTAPMPIFDSEQGLDIDLSELIGLDEGIASDDIGLPTIPSFAAANPEPGLPLEPPGNLIDFDLDEFPVDKPKRDPR